MWSSCSPSLRDGFSPIGPPSGKSISCSLRASRLHVRTVGSLAPPQTPGNFIVVFSAEPPVGKVTRKVVDDSVEVLICQAFGFHPKEIQATWTRDGEVCQNETLQRNVAPNSDETYYVQISIEINPKERDHYQCHLDHKGLPEPLVLTFKEKTGRLSPWAIIAALILGAGIFFLIRWWRKRRRTNLYGEVTSCSYQTSSQGIRGSPVYGAEDETQSLSLMQTKLTSRQKASYGSAFRTRSDPEILSSCCRQEENLPLVWNGRGCSPKSI
ncbi:putative HLA class I histocompatibility antigen, alpha chain H [Thamnophis elegans]|uniref:putative HLA class I histocompatibility antigen, alpha chain H n=1 Tax=Thamnophis elegans TaxID=35005 RepID=UPI001378B827|nr:putative HLA class I histocompatibility antigen, alpha chain H [Thamnophis elegans]